MISHKLKIKDLLEYESRHDLWKYKFFKYPIWIHCREDLILNGIQAHRKIVIPSLWNIIKSTFFSLYFLIYKQHFIKKVYFLMHRNELLESFIQDEEKDKVLFLHFEQEHNYNSKYISADFFNTFRFLCRKITYIIYYKQYQYFKKKLIKKTNQENIKIAMGDALWLKVFSLILRKRYKKYYSGCLIPIGEKFINRLNSYEVQHGVIHNSHVGYIGLPNTKNTLMLYHQKYIDLLDNNKYKGVLVLNTYKKYYLQANTNREFDIVLYTQPIQEMQQQINIFLQTYDKNNIYIQKHPKDYFKYNIKSQFIVQDTLPKEVKNPIFYCSSCIENFTLDNRTCYIWDVKVEGINLKKILNIFRENTINQFIIKDKLEDIIKSINE